MGKKQVLTVPGRYDQIQVICEFVAEGAREAGMEDDDVFQVELCCDEASTNIIEHAYGGEDKGTITITVEASSEAFQVTLHDKGRAFDPDDVPAPPVLTSASSTDKEAVDDVIESLQVGGLGIHFMRNLMDEVHYEFDNSEGNTLVMVKKIGQGGEQ